MKKKHAVIYLCKGLPSRSGGGLGVAYNYLSATWNQPMAPVAADHILFCGEAEKLLEPGPVGLDGFLSSLDPGPRRGASLFAWQAGRVREIARNYEKVVVLAFTPFYLWPLVRPFKGGNIVTVHSEHGKGGRHHELAEERGSFGWRERFVEWCVGWNFRLPDHVVFPSRGALNLFIDKNPALKEPAASKSVILYNGVATCEAPPPRPGSGPLEIISVAHHVREKGLDVMVEALRRTTAAGVDWHMLNFGHLSGLTDELRAQAGAAGIGDRIEFAGLKPQAEVRGRLAAGDVFLHTPTIVVFDLSLLEAMMHAIPVVTVPLEGNREALGEDYPLYATTPDEIAERLRWIAGHRAEADAIGRGLRQRALEMFTNEALVGHYARFLGRLLE